MPVMSAIFAITKEVYGLDSVRCGPAEIRRDSARRRSGTRTVLPALEAESPEKEAIGTVGDRLLASRECYRRRLLQRGRAICF